MKELYFTTYFTENEHGFVEFMLREECPKRGFTLVYYRKFKEGHQPMYRECKIMAESTNAIKKMLDDLEIEWDNANENVYVKVDGKDRKIKKWMRKNLK